MIPANYHTHSTFCDGRDTPEETVREAIRLGMPELGFSGHSYLPGQDYTMSPEGTEAYKKEIRRLQKKYEGQIRILLGVEQDYCSDTPTDDYDYVIGSVHGIPMPDGYLFNVDESEAVQTAGVERYFGGDYYAFAEAYYALEADIYRRTKCDIIGHFDLITKYNEGNRLFDTSHPRYRRAAERALEELLSSPAAFELNTGAIARGYRKTPYPEPWILAVLRQRGRKIIFSSDCHDKTHLLTGISFSEQIKE